MLQFNDICHKIVYFYKGRLLRWKFMLSKSDHTARFGPRNGDPSHPRHPKYENTAKAYIIKEYLQV